MRTILAPTQDAAKLFVENRSGTEGKLNSGANPIIWATGLGTGETIKVQLPVVIDPNVDRDADWMDMYMDGSATELTPTNNIFAFYSVIAIRLVKASTTAAVGIIGTGWTLKF